MAWAEGQVHSLMLLVCASKVIHAKDLAPRDLPEFEFTFFQQTARGRGVESDGVRCEDAFCYGGVVGSTGTRTGMSASRT